MNPRMLGRIATTSLIFGIATVGCTSTAQMNHPAALASRAPQRVEVAARAASKADAALAAHQSVTAVDAAEKAVAADPNNGGYRLLLGRSYLAAGRFASAGTSFRDAPSSLIARSRSAPVKPVSSAHAQPSPDEIASHCGPMSLPCSG